MYEYWRAIKFANVEEINNQDAFGMSNFAHASS